MAEAELQVEYVKDGQRSIELMTQQELYELLSDNVVKLIGVKRRLILDKDEAESID